MCDRSGIGTTSIYFDMRIGVNRVEIRVETVKQFKYMKLEIYSNNSKSKFKISIVPLAPVRGSNRC
jgi:hypothetical protein